MSLIQAILSEDPDSLVVAAGNLLVQIREARECCVHNQYGGGGCGECGEGDDNKEYLKINGKDYFRYKKDDFEPKKWYVFSDAGSEGTSRSGPFDTKAESVDGNTRKGSGQGVYEYHSGRTSNYIMTGKTALIQGFDEWVYEVQDDEERMSRRNPTTIR